MALDQMCFFFFYYVIKMIVYDASFSLKLFLIPGGAQAEGAGAKCAVGPGERQDAQADPGVSGKHGPPPHCLPV